MQTTQFNYIKYVRKNRKQGRQFAPLEIAEVAAPECPADGGLLRVLSKARRYAGFSGGEAKRRGKLAGNGAGDSFPVTY